MTLEQLQQEAEKRFEDIKYTGVGGFEKIKSFLKDELRSAYEQGVEEARKCVPPVWEKDSRDKFNYGVIVHSKEGGFNACRSQTLLALDNLTK